METIKNEDIATAVKALLDRIAATPNGLLNLAQIDGPDKWLAGRLEEAGIIDLGSGRAMMTDSGWELRGMLNYDFIWKHVEIAALPTVGMLADYVTELRDKHIAKLVKAS